MEISPQDRIEGLLAVQMIATHHAALDCLRRAAVADQTFRSDIQESRDGAEACPELKTT